MSREALWLAAALFSCSRPHPDAPKIVADPPKVADAGVDVAKPPEPKPEEAKTACTKNAECAFEAVTGTCRAGTAHPMTQGGGGFCRCDAGTCAPESVAPVPCKKTTDCSWLEDPWRPAPASKVPRPHPPVVPCKTGGRDSVCDGGFCVLRVWKC